MEQVQDLVDFQSDWYKNANREEQQTFREWLLGVLRSTDTVEVTFTKKDGTLREMKCTLKEGIAPKVENPKESDTLCTVWDTVLEQWRSFHFENITKINFSL
jgi:hypothetical protein